MQKKILFVGHDANRAGAQHLLLHLLTYLKGAGFQTGLVLVENGPLLEEFEKVTTVFQVNRQKVYTKPKSSYQKVIRRIQSTYLTDEDPGSNKVELLNEIRSHHFDLIFSNTIANGATLKVLSALGLPFVCYVHELETSIRIYTKKEDLEYQIKNALLIICGSTAVRDNLISSHGLNEQKASVLNSLIDTRSVLSALKKVSKTSVKSKLGIPENALVIGGCGNSEWRKGIDIFILVAREVLKTNPVAHFIWVGISNNDSDFKNISHDIDKMGISQNIHLIPPCANYLDYVCIYDIFVLTSREDPYPLVILEAGLNKIPVICFAGSGGSPDFVGRETGCVVDYLDVAGMANVILNLGADVSEMARLGEIFYKRANLHDVEILVPQMLSLLSQEVIQQ